MLNARVSISTNKTHRLSNLFSYPFGITALYMYVVVFPLVCLFCLHYNIIMLVLSSSRVDHSCAVSVIRRVACAFYVIFFNFLGQKGPLIWIAREFFRTKNIFTLSYLTSTIIFPHNSSYLCVFFSTTNPPDDAWFFYRKDHSKYVLVVVVRLPDWHFSPCHFEISTMLARVIKI